MKSRVLGPGVMYFSFCDLAECQKMSQANGYLVWDSNNFRIDPYGIVVFQKAQTVSEHNFVWVFTSIAEFCRSVSCRCAPLGGLSLCCLICSLFSLTPRQS